MHLFNKEHLESQMHNKNDCCITEEHCMDIHLGFLKHPKNAANLLKVYLNLQENHMVIMTIYNVLISVLNKFKIKKRVQYTQVAE